MCCRDGKVELRKIKEAPEYLKRLLSSTDDSECSKFKELIRVYNSCYAFTSMGAKIDHSVNTNSGPYVFRISGQVLHRIGSLLPPDDQDPSYAQLYVYDSSSEIAMREKAVGKSEGSPKLDTEILARLKDMLDEVNPLTKTFRMAQERLKEQSDKRLSIRLLGTRNHRDKTYNTPIASEIAALIVDSTGDQIKGKDIIIEHKTHGLQRISELHPSYMALQYPLLFPYGEDSYHTEIPYIDQGQGGKRKNVTMREYYAYRVQQRISEGSTLLCGGRLFQQFLVDSCCAIESERLWYIKNNQDKFRCDILNNLCDAVANGDCMGYAVGKRVYMPPSFTGGPRYMQQCYQDAMAICRWYGNPHLFITFTANPKWPEIEAMLQLIPGQKVEDRPDIVARVFRFIKKGVHQLDNRSIVPYNPGLLLMFDAHINVEWCNTAKAIKYLFKYISKGPDKATFMIKDDSQDEVKAYLDCRYLSASEAAWRIFEFEIQERYLAVIRLPVQLKGEQAVIIMDHDVLQVVIDKKSNVDTMLSAWMKKNAECQDARTLTYA
ncbi:uncharacterized protein LOC141600694 [Silene latifolia]|uniref:uncharacterized protein LOC141600694 n=1 Tax=Silene latifolia TaxID=37657 RepID=UPI003D7834A5